MRGRKPKPTRLKLVEGNPGRRPLPENEPEPVTELPPAPAHLDDAARAEWDRIGAQLLEQGLVSHLDMAALAAYCVDYSRWAFAEEEIRRTGIVLWQENGKPLINPLIA